MKPTDLKPFATLFADVMAYYRQDVSDFTRTLFWTSLQAFDFEQVRKAFDAHAKDSEQGRFAPKLADLVRILQGTYTDRAQLAWGRCLEAMRSVGAYTDVIFDDPATHAAIEGRGRLAEALPHADRRTGLRAAAFCKAHKAYVGARHLRLSAHRRR